ncbi:MAG: Gfo/Idh/MocA family oxidoreductase [Candidatus Lokiarchaeota archaeon]|nr:Gfo/Idh/MocA family oxidoreductase [Candidatus Lokiarchaeota archaeon]
MVHKIKVGLIGSGFIAEHHVNAYKRLPNVEIMGISSLMKQEAKKLMTKYSIPGEPFADYTNLLKMDLDVVSLCIPNFLHETVGIEALEAQKHVLVEKPLTRTTKEGKNLIKTADRTGKSIYYCENNMYAPSFSKIKEIIKEGALGSIYMGRGKEQHSGPHSQWFYKKNASGGGALLDLGIHDIALLRWYLDSRVERVFCQTTTIQPDRGKFGKCEVEDNAMGILYFENGAQVVIEESWTAPGGYDMKIELYGTNGQIIADPCRMTPVTVYSETGYGYAVEKASTTAGWTFPVPDEPHTFGYPQEIAHFIHCIKYEKNPLSPGTFGLEILQIIETMYTSAKTGKIEQVQY